MQSPQTAIVAEKKQRTKKAGAVIPVAGMWAVFDVLEQGTRPRRRSGGSLRCEAERDRLCHPGFMRDRPGFRESDGRWRWDGGLLLTWNGRGGMWSV